MNSALSNFIPVNRKLFKHEFWEEDRAFSRFEAWLDLVASARFDGTEGRKLINGVIVRWQRGQMLASVRFLALRWGWTNSKVQRYLTLLKEEKMIATDTATGTGQTVITICNYDTYNNEKASFESSAEQLRYTDDTAAIHARYKTNKENKEQQSKERKTYKSFAHLCLFDDEFVQLTQAGYSKKQIDTVLAEIENYKNNKKYVSLFLTAKSWLQKNHDQKVYSTPTAQTSPGRVVNIVNAFQSALQYG